MPDYDLTPLQLQGIAAERDRDEFIITKVYSPQTLGDLNSDWDEITVFCYASKMDGGAPLVVINAEGKKFVCNYQALIDAVAMLEEDFA